MAVGVKVVRGSPPLLLYSYSYNVNGRGAAGRKSIACQDKIFT